MAQMIVGLDVGTTSVKVTRLQASLLRFEFVDFQEHALPSGTDLSWEQLVTHVLRVLFSDASPRADRVITNLPGRAISSRLIHLPFSDRKKIAQTLPFEIEGLIPVPLESILLDYQIIDTGPQGTRILAFFAEKQALQAHLSLLQEAGVDPNAVLPVPVALANLRKELPPHGDSPCALIDLGDSCTSLAVLGAQSIVYGRSWAMGSCRLTEALARALDTPPALARETKETRVSLRAPGDPPPHDASEQKIDTVLKEALGPIVVGIKQTLLSVSEGAGCQVATAYLCGNASRLGGLQRYLADTLQLDVQPLSLTGPVGQLLQQRGLDPASAATSLGLAFHGIRDMKASKINLRTAEFTYVSERAELKRQLLSGGIMAGILLSMLLILFGLRYSERSQRCEALNASLESLALETFPELKDVPPGQRRITSMTTRLEQERRENDLFAPLSQDSLSVLDILRELTAAVPKDVEIDVRDISMDGEKVRLEAETNSYNAAEQIKQNLLSSGLFVNADIPEAKDSLNQNKVKFKMNLQLKEKIL